MNIRRATEEDANRILEIRNDPLVRKNSIDQTIISLESHLEWFSKKYFKEKNNFCFVVEKDNRVIGYLRLDEEDNHYLLSIALDASYQGQGIGSFLLNGVLKKFNFKKPILAQVKKENLASINLFKNAGFKLKIEKDPYMFFILINEK